MINGLDPIGSALRHDPIFMEGRGPVIDAEQARMLGLRNGQVVQAVVTAGPSALQVLWPEGLRQGLPTALQAFPLPSRWAWAAGTTHALVATMMPNGSVMLSPLLRGATSAAAGPAAPTAAPPATGASPATAMASEPYSLGQAYAAALGGAATAEGAGTAGEVARLMQQAPAWMSLVRLLQVLAEPERDSAMGADRDGPAADNLPTSMLSQAMGAALPRMAGLTPEVLRQAMLRSGLGTEAALLAGASGQGLLDVKVALRRLLRQGDAGPASLQSDVARGVDTLERSQIDSLGAAMQGQVLLSMAIPFGDAGPVALRLFRERAQADGLPPPFVVDIQFSHSGLGPLWLRTVVGRDARLAMTMWAERAEVAELARERARDLRWGLTCNGLTLSALDIISGPRPPQDDVFAEAASAGPKGAGA